MPAPEVGGTLSFEVNNLRHEKILVKVNGATTVEYPSFWLRDHCGCSECLHPYTKQRQVNAFERDPDIHAVDFKSTAQGLEVVWSQDEHKSTYQWDWLSRHIPFTANATAKHPRSDRRHLGSASAHLARVAHDSVMTTDAGLSELLEQIRSCGFSFISNTPPTPEATEKLLERISFIRPTILGSLWEFTNQAQSTDTACTHLALPLHTDTTFLSDPAGLLLFHCLQVATEGGGQSTFADGFAAAAHLYKVRPDYYDILSSVRVVSLLAEESSIFGEFINNVPHAGGFPVFTHSVPHEMPHPNNLTQIRWNDDHRHSSTQWPNHQSMIMWYDAARLWQKILASKDFQWEVQLQPGKPVIFDNWRILHGRKAYEGQRRFCGAYIGMDEFRARIRMVTASNAGQAQPTTDDKIEG